jgi:O-antigen/teichoic acid export membrane protein
MKVSDLQSGSGLRKQLGGTISLMILPLVLNAISLPVLAYIIRSLGASGYGSWSTASNLAGTLAFMTNLGLRMHFIRQVASEPETAQAALREQLGMRILLSVVAAAIAVTACALLHYPSLVLICTTIAGVGIVLATISTTFLDLLQARHKLQAYAFNNFVSGILLTASSVLVIWAGYGAIGLAISYLVGPIVAVVLGIYVVRRQICPVEVHLNLGRFWEVLKQSRVLTFQVLTSAAGSQIESLLTPKLVGIAQNGYFSAGIVLPSRLGVLADALSTSFYPVLSRKYQESIRSALRTSFIYLAISVLLCIPVAAIVSLLSNIISVILFPHNSEICRRVMDITIWILPIAAVSSAFGYTLNACRREKAEATCSLIVNACGIAISYMLILKYGLIGACASLLVRSSLGVIVRIPPFLQLVVHAWRSAEDSPEPELIAETEPEPAIEPLVSVPSQE